MSPGSIDTRPTPALRHRRGAVLGLVLALAVGATVVAELAPRLAVPRHIATLRVVNPTVYQVNLDVADGDDGPWLDLGTFNREASKTVEQVGDQGRRWVFRLSSGGVDAGRFVVARSALERAGWTLRIPQSAGDRLREAGLAPSAR